MKLRDNSSESLVRISEVIAEVEESYFVGRHNEVKFFLEHLQEENPTHKIIYFYGEGGIGKTFLLHEFSRVAARQDILFISLDSEDFRHTTTEFVDYLYNIVISHIHLEENVDSKATLMECLNILNHYGKKIIIVMDTYEQMEDLDRWFRNAFLRQLHPRISVILAGRKRLTGEWIESPAWRSITKQIKLEPFSFTETYRFLVENGLVSEEKKAQVIWEFTKGNPLLLTLAAISQYNEEEENCPSNNTEILRTLTSRWLNEVRNETLLNIIEVAALFHQFDQNNISEVLEQEVSNRLFLQLTSLSFIRKTQNGWTFHELIRDALRVELQQRNPDRYDYLTNRIINYYYQRIKKAPTVDDIASFFYHIGNDFLQSVFFQDSIMDTSMYLEPVGAYNFHEVEEYIEYQLSHIIPSSASYYNRKTNTSYHFDVSAEHNRREIELISPEYIKKWVMKGLPY
ncbi:ATP-binding protein [Ornithinibacillus scapharcae]|uniref:ATP-binding protein n=1 Tax=Ornithinibacillus scapharcae TaxID=1147159 RepID=UPI00031673A8|nr:ATP-binding protein [Ornithinibacillus scapharcae]